MSTLNQRWAAQLVGALVAGGVRDVVIAPGSRSTPLALAVADRAELCRWSVLDERSAAFFALGLAKGAQRPAAVLCTSGTAGAHFLPAAMEASEGATPLVLLTADRPWELHGFGAPQTANQSGLFGRFVRASEDLGVPEDSPELFAHLAAVVCRAVLAAAGSPRGPVHLNVPFREPLADASPGPVVDAQPTTLLAARGVPPLGTVAGAIRGAERGVVVCGPRERDDGLAAAVHALSERVGFPVLAEAASNVRYGARAVSTYEALLRDERLAGALRPDVVLRFGGGLTSKALAGWLDASGARSFVFSDEGLQHDPGHRAEQVLVGDAVGACAELARGSARDGAWRERLLRLNDEAISRLESLGGGLTEPVTAAELVAALPPGACLVLSSSMPIRLVDAFGARARGPLRVYANRGVNGIDGVTSTALGVAAGSGRPTALFTGDLALLHDLSGLLVARRHGLSLAMVVVNNDGGGIFSFLPVADRTAHFEELFGTPHGVELGAVAALAGARHHQPVDPPGFRRALGEALEGGLHLIEVRTRRDDAVATHRAALQHLVEGVRP